jgi:hypothetical protein
MPAATAAAYSPRDRDVDHERRGLRDLRRAQRFELIVLVDRRVAADVARERPAGLVLHDGVGLGERVADD